MDLQQAVPDRVLERARIRPLGRVQQRRDVVDAALAVDQLNDFTKPLAVVKEQRAADEVRDGQVRQHQPRGEVARYVRRDAGDARAEGEARLEADPSVE